MSKQQLALSTKMWQLGDGAWWFDQPAAEEGVLEADEEAAEGQSKGKADRETGGKQQSAFPEKHPGDVSHGNNV